MRRTGPVVVLLLLVAPLFDPSLAQVQTEADLAVVGVQPGSPAVGAPRDIQATVHNNGPSAVLGASVVFYWNDLNTPVTGSTDTSRAQGQEPLGPGSTATITLAWTPSSSRAGAGILLARVEVPESTSDPDLENNVGQQPVFVVRPGHQVVRSWGEDPVEVQPGAEHALSFTVRNTGNVEGTFVPDLNEPDLPDWTVSVAPASRTLLPTDTGGFNLLVRAPADALAGDTMGASDGFGLDVVQQGYGDSDVGVSDQPVPSIVVAALRALELASTEVEPGKPGTSLVGTLTVLNEGNRAEEVTLDRSTTQGDAPASWNVSFSSPVMELDAFSSAQTAFQVDLPPNATAGNVTLVLVATGAGGALPPATSIDVELEVLQVHRVSTTSDTSELALLGDQEGLVALTITNDGNGDDTMQVTLTAPDETWAVESRPPSLELGPDEVGTVELAIRPPPGHAPASDLPVEARVTTRGGVERDESTEVLTVEVLAGPNVRLASVPSSPRIDRETGLTLALELVNGGNQRGNATVTVTAPTGWRAFTNLARAELELGASRLLSLTVTAPEASLPGDVGEIEVELDNEGAGPTYTELIAVTVGGPNLLVALEDAPTRLESGESAELTARVESRGLRAAPSSTIVLEAQGNRGARTIATWEIASLAPGSVERRTVTWDSTDWAGDVLLTVTVDPLGEIAEEDENDNEEVHSVFVSALDVQILVPPPIVVDPGQRVRLDTPPLAVAVTNEGNARARLNVRFTDEGGWIAATESLALDADEQAIVPLTLTVPRPAGVLTNNATVRVTSQSSFNGSWQASWAFQVRDVAPPRVLDVNFTDAPVWGRPVRAAVVWDDGTGIRSGTAQLRPSGETGVQLPLEMGSSGPVLVWTPDAVGRHEITITLTDLAGNAAPSLPFSVNVSLPDPPTIRTPTVVRLRPGGPLPLEIGAPAPLTEVAITAFGIRSVLSPPYRVNTSGWTEGEDDVLVQATDALGQMTGHTFRVVVDATPPTLDSAEADPDRADPGETAVVALGFNEPVSEAAIVLVLPDGVRELHDADRLSEVRWEARFALPDDDIERVDVQATDLAGNAALIEDAVDLSVSRGLPWVGGWALVVLIGLAALVGRARRAIP